MAHSYMPCSKLKLTVDAMQALTGGLVPMMSVHALISRC